MYEKTRKIKDFVFNIVLRKRQLHFVEKPSCLHLFGPYCVVLFRSPNDVGTVWTKMMFHFEIFTYILTLLSDDCIENKNLLLLGLVGNDHY